MIGQGFVQNYSSLLATRFLLGWAEAGIFPGSFYLISFWYKPEEAQKRFTVYWSSTIVAGAFGGLLSSAIAELDGVRGLTSWRWVFIIEGIATVAIGGLAFFCISDFPRQAKWLTESERQFLLKKTETDESHAVPVTTKDMVIFISKASNWFGAIMYFCEFTLDLPLDDRPTTDLDLDSSAGVCLLGRLLRPLNCSGPGLQYSADTITFGAPVRCSLRVHPYLSLSFGSATLTFTIHIPSPCAAHHRPQYPANCSWHGALFRRVCGDMSHDHGIDRHRRPFRVLVRDEPPGPRRA